MIPVIAIDSRISDIMKDDDRTRWSLAERIRWANEAMGAILIRRPAAFASTTIKELVAGTHQTVTSAQLLDVVRNIGANGTTAGRSIRRTDRQLLDDSNPDWHKAKPKGEIRSYTFDDRVPKTFYVYPPAIAGTKVELLEAVLPPEVAEDDEQGQFDIGFEYLEAVINYVCYRANSKDSEEANAAVASSFYAAFEAALGNQAQAGINVSPNQVNNSV
jgi:hypothetical protein